MSNENRKPTSSDNFGRAVSKAAVAQICDSTGFHSAHRSALDALSDIAVRFVSDLGKAAAFYANLSGRVECNVFDVIQGLEDLELPHGFGEASNVHHCLVGSGVVNEITRFVEKEEEIETSVEISIPKFPVLRPSKVLNSFARSGEKPAGDHIPEWLPKFPDPHTYIHTEVWNERAAKNNRDEKVKHQKQRRKEEWSLLNLQRRLAWNTAAEGPSTVIEECKGKQEAAAQANPFLAPPLPAGEKDVVEIDVPRIPVLETFAPAIEAAKAASFDCQEMAFPSKRPTVHFRLGVKKNKSLGLLESSPAIVGSRSDSWPLRADEKDDKKRRAEMILKEAMENTQELIHM